MGNTRVDEINIIINIQMFTNYPPLIKECLSGFENKYARLTAKEKEYFYVMRTIEMYPEIWKRYCELIEHENWSVEQLAEYNFQERKRIVEWAFNNSPFYNRFYTEHGFEPNDLKSEEDWNNLPCVTKDMVRSFGQEMVVQSEMPFCQMRNTGGSTGKPLTIHSDKRLREAAMISQWRCRGWWTGRKRGELLNPNVAIIGVDHIDFTRVDGIGCVDSTKVSLRKQLLWPKKDMMFDVTIMDEKEMLSYAQTIIDNFEDDSYYVTGYIGGVDAFCKWVINKGIKLPKPINIATCASVLTNSIKKNIEAAFGALVFDDYCSNETVARVATDCLASNGKYLHLCSDLYHIDVVDDSGKKLPANVEGNVAVTVFKNHVQPLIKYMQGDRTTYLGNICDCGSPFPCISKISGREQQMIVDKNGNKLMMLSGVFDDYPNAVLRFQYRTKGKGDVKLLYVPNKEYTNWKIECDTVFTYLKNIWGDRIDLSFQEVTKIEDDRGKIRFIVFE